MTQVISTDPASSTLKDSAKGDSAGEHLRREITEALGTEQPTPSAGATSSEMPGGWTAGHTMAMSTGVLGYSLIVLAAAAAVTRQSKAPETALRLFTTVLIITSAVFLVVAGYSSQQIAPAFGLLGTMAGYVLGKSQSPKNDDDNI